MNTQLAFHQSIQRLELAGTRLQRVAVLEEEKIGERKSESGLQNQIT